MNIDTSIFVGLKRKKTNLKNEVAEIQEITLPTSNEIRLARKLDEQFRRRFSEEYETEEQQALRKVLRDVWKQYLIAPTVEDLFGEDDNSRDAKEVLLSPESMKFYQSGRLRGTNILHCLEIIDMDKELAEYSANIDAYRQVVALIFKDENKHWERFHHNYSPLPHEGKKKVAQLIVKMIREFLS